MNCLIKSQIILMSTHLTRETSTNNILEWESTLRGVDELNKVLKGLVESKKVFLHIIKLKLESAKWSKVNFYSFATIFTNEEIP